MESQFITNNFDKKNIYKNDISAINPFLLENNSKQAEQIFDFFKSDYHLLLVNGFMGTGKTSLINHVIKTAVNSIVIRYECFETTILDDILLSFFNDFKTLSEQNLITLPKSKFENFTQKINAFFEVNNQPITIVINSFEAILKANQTGILDFIKHLCSLKNVKVIIDSRNFNYDLFDIDYKKVTILALTKQIFEKYMRAEDCKQIGPLSNELYKISRGYFFYIALSLRIMNIRGLELITFIDKYSKSFLTFNDFILREALLLVDPISGHLFRFLTAVRHPINIKLLKTLNLYNEERVNYFIENMLLSESNNRLYLKDYYKIISENSIPQNVFAKLHQGCSELYNTQLPLKPLERDLQISRQTMRNEIEYHNMFVPQQKLIFEDNPVIEEQTQEIIEKEIPKEEVVVEETKDEETKDEKIKKMSFIFEDDAEILDKIADSINDFIIDSKNKMEDYKKENNLSLKELISYARTEEKNFNYKHSISLYQKALTRKDDDEYETIFPTLYTAIGIDYQHCSDWFNAQKYFEMAEEYYKSVNNIEKINEHKFYIANIYYITFKKEQAKEILQYLEKQNLSNELRLKVYNALANVNSNSNIAYNYYKKALSLDLKDIDKNILSEIYYKFALLNEDRADDDMAEEYYVKCIQLKKTPYLSSAMSNLATLYDEIGESYLATKYYLESIEIDKDQQNTNGIYTSSMRLAEIYSAKDYDKTIEYYTQAIECAYNLGEAFYIISSTTALGDYYFNKKEYGLSYKNYKIAVEICEKGSHKENLAKVLLRIEDIKLKVGEERFKQIEEQTVL